MSTNPDPGGVHGPTAGAASVRASHGGGGLPDPRGAGVPRPPVRTPASAVWLPLVVCVVSAVGWWALVRDQRHRFPDQLATHWGLRGRPDGFTAMHSVLTTNLVLCLVIPLPLLLLGLALRQARVFAPVVTGVSVLLGIELWGSVWAQRDHTQAATGDVAWPLPVGLVAGAVVAALTWLVVRPRAVEVPASEVALPAGAPVLDVPASGRLAWTGRTRTGRGALWAIALGVAVPLAASVVLGALGGEWVEACSIGALALVVLLSLSCLSCRVSVDARGVRAVGAGVIPWVRIPLASVQEASVEDVSPLGDFGGWGLRTKLDRQGASGLVTSAGPALRVRRAGRGDMFLTVRDADRAAATLNTLVVRRAVQARPEA